MNESSLIARYLAPLSQNASGSFALTNDGAVVDGKWVITKDAMVAGVHFMVDTPPAQIAQKLLRINLSDIAAMGAVPRFYLMAGMLPSGTDEAWWQSFCAGLHADQQQFDVTLIGGDTTTHTGELALSLTMLGELAPDQHAFCLSSAKPGDNIYVSGTIGDGYLGLHVAQQQCEDTYPILAERYHLPQPRIALSLALAAQASVRCVTDISDGLLHELSQICRFSDVGAVINEAAVPLSLDAQKYMAQYSQHQKTALLTGGDDYELLFAASPAHHDAIMQSATASNTVVTYIGQITDGKTVQLQDANGNDVTPDSLGYSHF